MHTQRRLWPAVYVNTDNGEVVRDGVWSSGVMMTQGDRWYAAIGLLNGAWLYLSLPPDYYPDGVVVRACPSR